MFVDLDRFKPINDVHGHSVGDQLLQVIAARVKSCIRDDSFAARLGGDEFAILLEGPEDRDGIATAAQAHSVRTLRADLDERPEADGGRLDRHRHLPG